MRILILGKSGLLGNALFRVFQAHHTLVTPPHELCDVTDPVQLSHFMEKEQPDVVINATGYTSVDAAEHDQNNAFLMNKEVVSNLIQALRSRATPLVHFSTDYVFDGSAQEGYGEGDEPHPISVYGASKAAGEKTLGSSGLPYYLIRTSWLFGEGGVDFIAKIFKQAREGLPLKVVNDQIGCPTYAPDLATAVLAVLQAKPYGIYHIVNSGHCSWYEYAVEVFQQIGWPQNIMPISSDELRAAAKRPHCSILLNSKLPPLRHWKEALAEYLSQKVFVLKTL